MRTTIKDIARLAEVSTATVSHVINKTRFVRPELVEKVLRAIEATDYRQRLEQRKIKLAKQQNRILAIVFPNLVGSVFAYLSEYLIAQFSAMGFLPIVLLSNESVREEKRILTALIGNKNVAGIVLAPICERAGAYDFIKEMDFPFLSIEPSTYESREACIQYGGEEAVYIATNLLAGLEHTEIALFLGAKDKRISSRYLFGYEKALADNGIARSAKRVLHFDPRRKENLQRVIYDFYQDQSPTAIVIAETELGQKVVHALNKLGIEYPHDVSVIACGDDIWCELSNPPVTAIDFNIKELGRRACEQMQAMLADSRMEKSLIQIPSSLSMRKSTQMIGKGPFGEKAYSAEDIEISAEEIRRLNEGHYSVAISFHYMGTAWARLHELGIRSTLEKFGISVLSVADAHFDARLQVTQLQGLIMQSPDAIIAIPTDDRLTSEEFKKIARQTRLLFLSHVPEGLDKNDYCSCVSVNERENGTNLAHMIGKYYEGREHVRFAILKHGATFYGTYLRDLVAEQVIRENYPNIDIVASEAFHEIENAAAVSRRIFDAHPQLDGMYVSWDRPALGAIAVLEERGIEAFDLFTCDLDLEIAQYFARDRYIRALSTQQPFKQGEVMALATAKALLGNLHCKYITVPPIGVGKQELLTAWKRCFHENAPRELSQHI